MTQRTLAGLIAAPLVLALIVLTWAAPLPYVVYRPGPTVDVLAEHDGQEIVAVEGHPTYRDEGELRMTTVSVTPPGARVDLLTLLGAWASDEEAVYPYDAVYEEDTTAEQNEQEGAAQMGSSQEVATAAALTELGQDLAERLEIVAVSEGEPADGILKPGDVLTAVAGKPVATPAEAVEAIQATPPGSAAELAIARDGEPSTVRIMPRQVEGTPRIGATLGIGFDLPFDVSISVGEEIGGPSAGLLFSLAIYDTLTPGSLTGGRKVAGSGEIGPDGTVGPIGGIQQKIAGARRDGAQLFLVPAANCPDAVGAAAGDMPLVKVETMHDAVEAITAWAEDPDTTLPSCGGDA